MAEFRTVSLAEQVFERLESDIIQGLYPCGAVLTELGLAKQLGVSRTPVRDALRQLEQEHLIKDTGKGALVLGISEEDLLDIMTVRQKLEGLASYYAAVNRTDQGLEELGHILALQAFYIEKRDAERLRLMDDDFHNTICRLCARCVISDILLPLHRKTRRYRKDAMEDTARLPYMLREHSAIYQAIAAGDCELAADLAEKHVENAKNRMLERMNQNG